MHFAQFFIGQMRVNLGSGNIGMAKEFLHRPQIRAVHQKIRGKAVAQHMRMNFFGDSGCFGPVFY